MFQERVRHEGVERASLRVRLVGVALAATLLVLGAPREPAIGGAALLAYALVGVALRYAAPALGWRALRWAGPVMDMAFASTMVLIHPLVSTAWALYALPITSSALRFGTMGAVVATAATVVAYDVALALRQPELRAADLWPLQVLLAIGFLVAELVWTHARQEEERRRLRSYLQAQREIAAADGLEELLSRITAHAVSTFGAREAVIVQAGQDGMASRHRRGSGGVGMPEEIALAVDPPITLRVTFEPGSPETERGLAAVRDMASDAAPMIARGLAHERAVDQLVSQRDALTKAVEEAENTNRRLGDELRQRDESLALTVHELRTPLTSVHAYGQLMSRNLHAVQRQVAQLERLIEDLVQLPGTRAAVTELVDLMVEAREAANRVRVVADSEVDLVREGSGPFTVRGDPIRLAQVLDNLLRNAVKFSPPAAPIAIRVSRSEGEVLVSVVDRGPGIAPDELPRIFERYFRGSAQQREVPGEGIGLALCRDIVLAHGGRIWATSDGPGRGSILTVALPAMAPLEGGVPLSLAERSG